MLKRYKEWENHLLPDFDLIKAQWDEEDELERLSLAFMEPMILGWKAIYASQPLDSEVIASFKATTVASLEYCWGDGSKVELKEGCLIFTHPHSGHKVEKFIAF